MSAEPSFAALRACITKHWGFTSLRPLQEQAMQAVLAGRDSLVVLPTGGGKSLCYQAPAVARGGTTVVVSPLIALMKDQVDSLRSNGIAASQLDSSLTNEERFVAENDLREGSLRLLFLSPERLVMPECLAKLRRIGVKTFAIDEAHCISHWGHDFRPEFRQMARLRDHFPGAAVHAYTATATEEVRADIIRQLALRDPEVLVGNFDRPNLTYRVLAKLDEFNQVLDVLDRHRDEAGIIYCLTRKDVDLLASALQGRGIQALPYHAGMSTDDRNAVQDAFRSERCDVVVATVAFGMGIDRSNVRFVLHTAVPKSLEHYQQETGRAGRDGLEAECVLFYSGGDVVRFKQMLRKTAEEANVDAEVLSVTLRHLDEIDRYCRGAVCRHRALVQHFGQTYEAAECRACDICLGDAEPVPEATVLAQKILSCVARVKESFGIGHVISVLRGENTEGIRKRRHDELTTFGLLRTESKAGLRDWIYQLIGQDLLLQVGDEYPILKLNAASWEILRGKRTARLFQSRRGQGAEKVARSGAAEVSWEGVDPGVFEGLRTLRRKLATGRNIPPYLVFSDATLREFARIRPSTLERMRAVSGVGEVKLHDYGNEFLQAIRSISGERNLAFDQAPTPVAPRTLRGMPRSSAETLAWKLFREEAAIEDILHQLERARPTVMAYLAEWIRVEKPKSIAAWVPDPVYAKVAQAARETGMQRLKPIFQALQEKVDYDTIRLVVSHLNRESP